MSLRWVSVVSLMPILLALRASAASIAVSGSMVIASLWGDGEVVGFDMDERSMIKWRVATGKPWALIEPLDESRVAFWTGSDISVVDSKTGDTVTKIAPEACTNAAICAVDASLDGRVVLLLRHQGLDYEMQCYSQPGGKFLWKQNLALTNANVLLRTCANVIGVVFSPVEYRLDSNGVEVPVRGGTGWMVLKGENGTIIRTHLVKYQGADPYRQEFRIGRRLAIRIGRWIWMVSGDTGEEIASLETSMQAESFKAWSAQSIVLGYPEVVEVVDISDLRKKRTIDLPGCTGAFSLVGNWLDYGIGYCDLRTGEVIRRPKTRMPDGYLCVGEIPFRQGTICRSVQQQRSVEAGATERAALIWRNILSGECTLLYEESRGRGR